MEGMCGGQVARVVRSVDGALLVFVHKDCKTEDDGIVDWRVIE